VTGSTKKELVDWPKIPIAGEVNELSRLWAQYSVVLNFADS